MGNEMGNNNTSDLKEEEYDTRVEDTKAVLKEENHVVAAIEDKEFHKKANGLASGDPEIVGDVSFDKQLPSEKDQDQVSEVLPLVDSPPKVEAESNEGDDESSKNQVSLSNTTEHGSVVEPNLEKTVPETRENQLPRQASVKKEGEEEEGIRKGDFDRISSTQHDPEPEKPAYPEITQQELAIKHDEPSLPDANGTSDGMEQDSGPSIACASTEKGRLSETEAAENLEESIDTKSGTITEKKMDESLVEHKALQEETKELCEEKFDGDNFENELSNAIPTSCERIDEGLTSDVCSDSESETVMETNSLKPDKEAPKKTEEKCLVLTEENWIIGMEFKNGEHKHENNSSQPCEGIVEDSKTEDSDAIQSESIAVDQKDEVKPSNDEVVNSHIKPNKEESKEKRVIEGGEENMETLYSIEIDQAGEVQSDHQQESVLSKNGFSIKEPKEDSCGGEFIATQASTFDCTNLIAEMIVSMNELAVDETKQDVKQSATDQTKISSKSKASATARDSLERFSTDSEADNMSVQYDQMRKSPSFSLDLQTEAKTEESDRTPLLYQDKAAIQISSPSQDDVISLGTPLTLNNGYSPQDQEITVQDKVVTLERSDSEKSKTPFLGFLKEEEEPHATNVVTPQKLQKETKEYLVRSSSTKEVSTPSTSTKGSKEKRKARSFLFGNCMCCATVIN